MCGNGSHGWPGSLRPPRQSIRPDERPDPERPAASKRGGRACSRDCGRRRRRASAERAPAPEVASGSGCRVWHGLLLERRRDGTDGPRPVLSVP